MPHSMHATLPAHCMPKVPTHHGALSLLANARYYYSAWAFFSTHPPFSKPSKIPPSSLFFASLLSPAGKNRCVVRSSRTCERRERHLMRQRGRYFLPPPSPYFRSGGVRFVTSRCSFAARVCDMGEGEEAPHLIEAGGKAPVACPSKLSKSKAIEDENTCHIEARGSILNFFTESHFLPTSTQTFDYVSCNQKQSLASAPKVSLL